MDFVALDPGLPRFLFFILWFVFSITNESEGAVKNVFFALFRFVYYTECETKNKKWGRPGNEAMDFAYGTCAV